MFSENFKIVPVLSDLSLASADVTMPGDSINISKYHKVTFVCGFQTIGGASATVKVFSGVSDGALTTALTFNYAWMSAAAGAADCDVLGAWTSAAIVTVTHVTYDNYTLIIEVDPAVMTSTHKWVTIDFQDPSTGATGNVQVHAILKPRFGSNVSVTALT
jgi:hypothetical protein